MQVETVLLSVRVGTVTLALVPEEDVDALERPRRTKSTRVP